MRTESPSSINTYNQCPRKYYYQYILKLPTTDSIHLIRGSIVHQVLEKFYDIDLEGFDKNDYEYGFRSFVSSYLLKLWKRNQKRLMNLGLENSQLEFYLIDSQNQLNNFVDLICTKLKVLLTKVSFKEAFNAIRPLVEQEIKSDKLNCKGIIDAIYKQDGEISILDYKTSKKDEITPAYKLQLGIYALLYKIKYNVIPKKVGINFLKFGEKFIDVNSDLLNYAELEIEKVHKNTISENIEDYPVIITPLCKWATGQCDFYDTCIKDR